MIYWVAAAVSVAVTLFAAVSPMLCTDTACRYAPMAEAFARGEWAEAFHPRFGVGLSFLSGVLCFLTGMDGYASCAACASLAWALAILPIFFIAESIFDRKTAWLAVGIYLVCPQPLLWALKGLREPFKMLGILLATDCLVSAVRREAVRTVLAKGIAAAALLILFKVDAILPAALFVLALLIIDRFGRRSLCVAASALVFLQPMCYLVYCWMGWWLPAPHYIFVLVRTLNSLGIAVTR